MDTVDVRNMTGQTRIVSLPHQDVCVRAGRCFCSANGSSGTVHLPANAVTPAVPAAILLAPDMKALLKGSKPAVRCTPSKAAPPAPAASEGKGERRSDRRRRKDGSAETEF